jgi:hypothetical protein
VSTASAKLCLVPTVTLLPSRLFSVLLSVLKFALLSHVNPWFGSGNLFKVVSVAVQVLFPWFGSFGTVSRSGQLLIVTDITSVGRRRW